MTLGRTRWCELLVGLERVRVQEAARDSADRLHVAVETIDGEACCVSCGQLGRVKDRDRVSLADLPATPQCA